MINHFAELLSPDQLQKVHEASLTILAEVGLLVRNEKARATFAKHGCSVDEDSHLVKFPSKVVEEHRKNMPPTFTFRGRDPKYDRTIPDQGPIIITGSSAPNIVDPDTGKERRAESGDIARIAALINALPGHDVFSISTLAEDAPEDQFSLSRFYPTLKYCQKPVRGNTPNWDDLQNILKLLEMIAGGKEAYRERPFVTHHYCPVVSPLTMDFDSTEQTMWLVAEGLPVYGSIVPNAGLTSPLTMVGTLAQGNAEFLALAVLIQMIRPGAELIYATLPTVADMRSGAYASGAIETGILHMGHSQLARFYNVPSGGYVGLTNSKINDAQSGYETGMSTVAAVLGGADMLNMTGLMDGLMSFDYAKVAIDDEIALMLKQIKRGLEFTDENLAVDVVKTVGPGGMFLDHPTTLKNMKTTGLLPNVSDRFPRRGWSDKGAADSNTRAMNRVKKLLSGDFPSLISPELDAQIRAEFPGMVSGDFVPFDAPEPVGAPVPSRN
jgi:trimethylamine---corrinoid protein Co-methyltransferase